MNLATNDSDEKENVVRAQAERDALAAAQEVLAPLRMNRDLEMSEYVKYILLAVQAVRHVKASAMELLDKEKDEYVYLEPVEIVASALWSVCNDMVGEDVHPYCAAAMPFLGFARACLILEAASNYQILVEDLREGSLTESSVDEAIEGVMKAGL